MRVKTTKLSVTSTVKITIKAKKNIRDSSSKRIREQNNKRTLSFSKTIKHFRKRPKDKTKPQSTTHRPTNSKETIRKD